MVDVSVLGTGALRRVGSSPTKGIFLTKKVFFVRRRRQCKQNNFSSMTKILEIVQGKSKLFISQTRIKSTRVALILTGFVAGNLLGLESKWLQKLVEEFVNLFRSSQLVFGASASQTSLVSPEPLVCVCFICLFLECLSWCGFLIDEVSRFFKTAGKNLESSNSLRKNTLNLIIHALRRGFILGFFVDCFKVGS